MSLQISYFICPTCSASKEIRDDLGKNGNAAFQIVPKTVPCGYRGCTDLAVLKETK